MMTWLWTYEWVGLDLGVCFRYSHNNQYAQELYTNYYIKTFDHKAEIKQGLKITEKYWWELY